MKETAKLIRLHIRPKGGLADHSFSFRYCLEKQVLGIGWPIEQSFGTAVTWEQYEELALNQHGETGLRSVRFLHDSVNPNDLIWTRDTDGKYYLAQVQEPWEYLDTEDGRRADIVNVVRCKIKPIEKYDDVPGKIVAHFIRGPAIRQIKDPTMVSYSQLLWNQLAESGDYPSQPNNSGSVFTYLDWETTEDVIFIYLQIQGWLIIPHSRKVNTMSYEFIAINCETYERAIVQVKTGNTELNVEDWEDLAETVFLFQANGKYRGSEAQNVICLRPNIIETFIRANIQIMPGAVQRWIKYLDNNEKHLAERGTR